METTNLMNLKITNLLQVASSMSVLSRTWNILLGECDRLTMSGIDLTFEVHRLLATSLQTALETNFTNILESIRLRTQVIVLKK